MADIRHVVTSFLRFRTKILLLQRSNRVGTYQGKWAGCSGYLEKSETPDDRSITEIQEETKLDKNQIKLMKKGDPLEIEDIEKGIIWVIYPYLYEIATDKIQLDWEHINYIWINPEEISKFQTVPNLKETYDRVKEL
jgi:8-oxo-dGTP diphosphatase